MPEGHLVSTPPLCQPCSAPQGQTESGGMVLVAYAGPVRPAAALRDSVLCLPTDIHSLFVNKPSSYLGPPVVPGGQGDQLGILKPSSVATCGPGGCLKHPAGGGTSSGARCF